MKNEPTIKWMLPLAGIQIMKVECFSDGTIRHFSHGADRSMTIGREVAKNREVYDTPSEALKAIRKRLVQNVSHAHDHYKHLAKKLEDFDTTNSELLNDVSKEGE
jgi:hypothetical protein